MAYVKHGKMTLVKKGVGGGGSKKNGTIIPVMQVK
jgi:hypothetical protein